MLLDQRVEHYNFLIGINSRFIQLRAIHHNHISITIASFFGSKLDKRITSDETTKIIMHLIINYFYAYY